MLSKLQQWLNYRLHSQGLLLFLVFATFIYAILLNVLTWCLIMSIKRKLRNKFMEDVEPEYIWSPQRANRLFIPTKAGLREAAKN